MPGNHANTQAEQQAARRHAALKRLDPLVGRWDMELKVPTDPPTVVRGLWTTLEWLEGRSFLVWRWGPARPDFPGGTFPAALSIIGYEDATGLYSMHYYDSRGVSRVLEMSLEGQAWKMWRDSPGFSQRFTGTFGDGGDTITVRLELSRDGSSWEHDFDMKLTRVETSNAA